MTVAVAAAAILLVATRSWGLGVSYDSVVYVQASRSLSSIDLPQARDHGGQPLYWWAPLYPVVLKLVGGGYSGARFLNAILLIIGSLLIGAVAWRAIDARAGLIAGALYAFSPAVFTAHLDLLAEPLFLVLTTASLAALADRRPVLAGVTAGAACLTRYSGLPLIAVGALVLRGKDRVRFLSTGLLPYLAWLARNELVADQTTGRLTRWHPPDWQALENGLRAVVRFLVTPGELPSVPLRIVDPGRLVQIVAAATLLYAVVRSDRRDPPAILKIGLIYAGFYCAFLLLATSVFDAVVPIDERLLVPIVPTLIIAIAWLVRGIPVAAMILCCLFALAVLQQARTVSLYGRDYSGRIWSAPQFDEVSLPPGRLYSNWPAAVAYFTGRSPDRLPRPTDAHTRDRNEDFGREMRDLARRVRDGDASLVILSGDFLEIPTVGVPLTETPPFRSSCQPAGSILTICTKQ
jgi:Dolichyl-phosphate-mannose-protein mannosyltransferase